MDGRRLIVFPLAVAALAAALPAVAAGKPVSGSVTVCNEAENSPRGGYTVAGGPVDPVPPAFLRGSQMRVGKGGSQGLLHAAEVSPALRTCGIEAPPPPGGGGDPPPT